MLFQGKSFNGYMVHRYYWVAHRYNKNIPFSLHLGTSCVDLVELFSAVVNYIKFILIHHRGLVFLDPVLYFVRN